MGKMRRITLEELRDFALEQYKLDPEELVDVMNSET